MINALDYLYNIIYEFWYYLLSELMIGSWSDPGLANQNIFNGTLLNINLTWNNLATVFSVFTIVLLIYLFIKFFVKLLGIFVWK